MPTSQRRAQWRKLFDGCIGCPYHGWTYDANGACVIVPSEGPGGAQTSSGAWIEFPSWSRMDSSGSIWESRRMQTRGSHFAFRTRGETGWSSYMMLTAFNGDVTDLVENFMDVPHTAFVHSGWFRKAGTAKRAEATVERTTDAVLVEYFQPDDSIGFARWLLNPDGKAMTHTDRFFMPNVTRVDYMWGERRGLVIRRRSHR